MLVASSRDCKNACAHDESHHGLVQPASVPRNTDMESATAADHSLGQPVSFAQPDNVTTVDVGAALVDLPQPTISDERVNAFARLRFDDGSYYMHTYQIILGRNIALAHKDMRRLAKVDQLQAEGHPQAAEALLHGKKDRKKKSNRRAARSVISEKGGIVNAPIESMPIEYQQRRQSNASHSISSASHPNGGPGDEKPTERAPQDVIMQAFPQVPAQFDRHVPEDPNDCPVVPIHPQHITARAGAQGPKGISRHHAKIFFDFDHGNFCAQVLGSNGLHHEDQFIQQGQVVPLDHGDRLLIGAVSIQFYLPDNALTEDQRHRQESGSRPMSFSFENGHGELESDEKCTSESEGELSINPRHVYHYPVDSDVDSEEIVGDDDMDDYEEPVPRTRQKQSLKIKIKAPPPAPPLRETKRSQKRKYREPTPDEPPIKKSKARPREHIRESLRESKASKEPKEPKERGKAPAKVPAKSPAKHDTSAEVRVKDISAKERAEINKAVPNDSPPLLRKPFEGEMEAGEIEGLITEEMARQHNLPSSLIGSVVEKRKGPGRPPKDGIMSKRQRSQLIKQAKEIERARAAGIDPADIPAPIIKSKTLKRKESNTADGEDDDAVETTERGDGVISGDKKQTKTIKPPRTPSPEMRVEDYTEEQLQRPSANYVVLIHEAISSSSTSQMNLQQIYNYIEKKYPWYKFKTTTSGWQSSVRHNLGQHDAFVKGDKEGKGFNWRVNPEISIEKERRKRQISPPINHGQRQPYYPPPNGYPHFPQSGYPYHSGVPHAIPPATPRLPPSLSQPRLPPSMARDGNTATATTLQSALPHTSPYASPWAGGSTAGSPSVSNSTCPYPPASSQTLPVSSVGPSSQYGVLYPTTAPQTHSGQQFGVVGTSPYAQIPSQSQAPYTLSSQPPNTLATAAASATALTYSPHLPAQGLLRPVSVEGGVPHPSGRYPLATHPDLIPQLEAFRKVYLDARTEPGEDKKVDNAIRACVDITVPEASLTESEKLLLKSIRSIEGVAKHLMSTQVVKKESETLSVPTTTSTIAAGTAAAVAADAAKNTVIAHSHLGQQSYAPESASLPTTSPQSDLPHPMHRPSVEPLTPVPGSPAAQNGLQLKPEIPKISIDSKTKPKVVKEIEGDAVALETK